MKKKWARKDLTYGRIVAYLPHVPSDVTKKVMLWVYVQRYNHRTHKTMNSFALVHEDDIVRVQIKAPADYVPPYDRIEVVLYPKVARLRPSKSYTMSMPRIVKECNSKVEDQDGMP
jgi:hypothetical protein